ncbi:MAG TPA: hypothetical protein VK808_08115 [Bacteroidia bacterium]|nr:hypothetical protein [Bacteroidia bacterium]
MKASLLKLQRRKTRPEKGPKSNYRIAVFSVCLLISAGFWLMNMLSKKYTESIIFYIQYEHLPQSGNRISATDTMRIKVNMNGYRVLGYKFGVLDRFIKIDATQFRHRDNMYFYTLSNRLHAEKIEEQLGEEIKVLDIAPDTLYIRPTNAPIPDKS